MAPLIPNGTYLIRNAQYSNYVAANFDSHPGGPIVASKAHHDKYHEWKITNIGGGGNQVTIESVKAPGGYASVIGFVQGATLFVQYPVIWTIVKVDGGKYYLQSPDGNFVWQLPHGAEGVQIDIIHHTGHADTKWSFEKA